MRIKRACKKSAYALIGGPFNGHRAYLTTASTMAMNVGGVRGRYVRCSGDSLKWEEL